MNNRFSKLNIFYIIKGKFRSLFDRDAGKIDISPERDWAVVLIVFLITSLSLMFFYRYVFLPVDTVFSGIVIKEDAELSLENISKSKLEKTLAPWIQREKKFSEYFSNRPSFDFLK